MRQPLFRRSLARVVGIGIETADMLVNEVLSRPMRDRRAVARYAGLTGAPDESGARRREQGLARAGNARARRGMIQLAWRFLRFQRRMLLSGGWLFPGRNPVVPLSARQLCRAVRAAAQAAGIKKRVSPHTLRHSFRHAPYAIPDVRSTPTEQTSCGDSGRRRSENEPAGFEPLREHRLAAVVLCAGASTLSHLPA